MKFDLCFTSYESLKYVDSWNQPVLLRIEDVISDDGKGKARFPNASLPAISSEIISNLQKSRLLLFWGDVWLFSKAKMIRNLILAAQFIFKHWQI